MSELARPDELETARRVATLFRVRAPIRAYDFAEKGNINRQTYLIIAGPLGKHFILQRLNSQVFKDPRAVMNSMLSCIEAQRTALTTGFEWEWEIVTLVPTVEDMPYVLIRSAGTEDVWRLMERIPDARTYKSLSEAESREECLNAAEQAGRGLGLFGLLTSAMETSALANPLPGYRDTRLYYQQFHSVLAGNRTEKEAAAFLPNDPALRKSTAAHFLVHLPTSEYKERIEDRQLAPYLEMVCAEKNFALEMQSGLESGKLRTVVIHGDTKIDNFLFSTVTGKVKALVDLDTVMPHTWLSDWGDMVRSFVNTAGEREPDVQKVSVDLEILEAVARGFFSSDPTVTASELDRMWDAVQTMALELGVRFLTDYLRGDTYFRLGPADPQNLNRTRAMVQLSLFRKLRERSEEARRILTGMAQNREYHRFSEMKNR